MTRRPELQSIPRASRGALGAATAREAAARRASKEAVI